MGVVIDMTDECTSSKSFGLYMASRLIDQALQVAQRNGKAHEAM